MRWRLDVRLFFLAAASLIAAPTRAQQAASLPDNPAGRRVQAYIEAFNSGYE
jgi:hypothetical protein